MTVGRHEMERKIILDGILPLDPLVTMERQEPPKTPEGVRAALDRLNMWNDQKFLKENEYEWEKQAIENMGKAEDVQTESDMESRAAAEEEAAGERRFRPDRCKSGGDLTKRSVSFYRSSQLPGSFFSLTGVGSRERGSPCRLYRVLREQSDGGRRLENVPKAELRF